MQRDLRTIIQRSGLVAGVVAVGLSMAACSSGDDAAAASESGSSDTVVADDPVTTNTVNANTVTSDTGTGTGTDLPGQGGPATFSRGVSGEVSELDGSTITVEQVAQDGTITETIVETTDDTTVTEMVAGTLDDLAVGDEVVVSGGTDGTAATTISEGGAMFGGGPGAGRPPGGDGQGGMVPPDGATPPDGSLPDGATPPEFATGVPGGPGGPDGRGGVPGGIGTFGTISEIGDGTITLDTADGESVVVTVDDATAVTLAQDREVGDIAEGDTIRVQSPPTDASTGASDETAAVVADRIVIQTAT